MSELSTYLANAILAWVKGTTMPAAPSTVYVALYNGDPGATGSGGTDVTEDIRAAGRVAVSFGAVSARAILNNAEVDFGTSDSTVSVTHGAIFDAASGGNMLGRSALDTPRTITAGDPVVLPIGDVTMSFPFA